MLWFAAASGSEDNDDDDESESSSSESGSNNFASGHKEVRDDVDDDVIFVGVIEPTDDQRSRAEKLLLPKSFYLYENLTNEGEMFWIKLSVLLKKLKIALVWFKFVRNLRVK